MEWQRLIPERNDSSGMLRACGFKHSRHSLYTQAVSRRETVTGSQVRVQRWPASHMSELSRKVGPPHTCRARRTPGQAGRTQAKKPSVWRALIVFAHSCQEPASMPTPARYPTSFRPGCLTPGAFAPQADSGSAQSASSPQELRSVSSFDSMPTDLVRTRKRSRGSRRPSDSFLCGMG